MTPEMQTIPPATVADALGTLFAELTQGAPTGGAYILNSSDVGLLRSLDKLTAAEASASVHEGATIAAHALHLRYGISLMNRWASEGGNPFANALWEEAWMISRVSDAEWGEIRDGLRTEIVRWSEALRDPPSVNRLELKALMGSVAHLAYHLGAMRQIAKTARGPKEGSYSA